MVLITDLVRLAASIARSGSNSVDAALPPLARMARVPQPPEGTTRILDDESRQGTCGGVAALEASEATYHRWRNQYGGMKAEEAKRLTQLKQENGRLKKLVADQALDIHHGLEPF